MTLRIVPIRQREARAFVAQWHRRLPPPQGAVFCLGVACELNVLRGVAMVGRPVARHLDNGQTLEVNRTATDGARNANSMLYGAAWRAARALGWSRLVTYNEADETGASLRAAGWRVVGERPPRPGWDTPSRRRGNVLDPTPRTLWEAPV